METVDTEVSGSVGRDHRVTSYHPSVDFFVLGPVRVLREGDPVQLKGPKQRAVLAVLIAHAGRPTSPDALIDAVWGDQPPPAARATLQSYISRVRTELGDVVVLEGGGYRLAAERDRIDSQRFEDAVERARTLADSHPAEAAKLLGDVLALWRGHPYADVPGVAELQTEARRLEELRLQAVEARIQAELALGRHAEVLPELEVLTTENPLAEGFRSQHMVALYRAGRQAEALRAYQKTRLFLAEEMGIDPSPQLQGLEQRILEHDPSLDFDVEPKVQTLAFFMTDVEDSTVLWELHPEAMPRMLERHERILVASVEQAGGRVFNRSGDGFAAVFTTVADAVTAAESGQRGLLAEEWGDSGEIRVRMAVDAGEVESRADDFFGPPLNRCARILAAAHGGQVLLSEDAHRTLSATSDGGWQVRAMGEHRFKGLGKPQHVFQLLLEGLSNDFPPLRIDRLPAGITASGLGRAVRGYELRERVGAGDFGIVYRAYQPTVGREVAVKVIRPEYVNKPEFVRRFEAEAHIVAQLEHPHIVPLYDYWREPDGAYLVTRWLRGGCLRDALERGPWHIEPGLRLLGQIGSALDHAHRRGVIHRDLKPANVLLDEDGNGYVADFGIAARLMEAAGAAAGSNSPAYLAPEELAGDPLTPAVDLYAMGTLAFEVFTGRRPPMDSSLPTLGSLQPGLPDALDEVIARARANEPAERYRSAEEFLAAIATALGQTPAVELGLTVARNPYKGLQAFQEADAPDFWGRSGMVEELVEAIRGHSLVAVVGPSGIGKSSVVRAGLVPAVRAGALSGEWLVTDMYPGAFPFEELSAALLKVAVQRTANLVEELAAEDGMLRMIDQILPAGSRLLLVIDQFEELFTLTQDEETRRFFLDGLVSLAEDDGSPVTVVVTMRADFLDRPLGYPEFGELLGAGMVTVAAPGPDELVEAVTRPAEGVGVRFEEGLADRIVDDVADEPGALPLLQFALTELFDQREIDLLTLSDYQRVGGVSGALGRRGEELYGEFDGPGREAARQVFLRLVAVDESGHDTRRRIPRRDLQGLSLDPGVLEEVLNRYGEHRLLTFDRHPITRTPTVEIAHEALITHWDRLRGWIDDRREDLVLHRRLGDAATEWDSAGQGAAYLLAGGRLQQMESLAAGSDLALSDTERGLLQTSRVEEDRQRDRRTKRRRAVLGGFAAAAALSLGLAGWALVNQGQAEEAAAEAEQQREIALANEQRAEDEAARAVRNEEVARSRQLSAAAINELDEDPELSVLLALEAAHIAEPPIEAVSALHEALYNLRVVATHTWPAERSMSVLSTDLAPDGRFIAAAAGGSYLEVVDAVSGELRWEADLSSVGPAMVDRPFFSANGTEVVAGIRWPASGPEGEPAPPPPNDGLGVYVWDAVTGDLVARHDVGGCGGEVLDLATPGLALVRTPVEDGICTNPELEPGALWLLDLSSGATTLLRESLPPKLYEGASLSADGRFVVWGDLPVGLPITVTELASGETVYESRDPSHQWARVLSPDGSLLLTGDRPIQVWDVAANEQLCVFDEHNGDTIGGVGFSDDGTMAFSTGRDGTVRLWDARTCTERAVLRGGTTKVSPAMSTAGSTMVAADQESPTFRTWSLLPTLPGEVGAVETCRGFVPTWSLDLAGQRGALLVACEDKPLTSALAFDPSSGDVLNIVENRDGQLLRLSPDGERFVSMDASLPFTAEGVSIRDTDTGRVLTRLQGLCRWDQLAEPPYPGCEPPPGSPNQLWLIDAAFSPDGSLVAAIDWPLGGFTFGVWDSVSGERIYTDPVRDDGRAAVMAFSVDGRRLFVLYASQFSGGQAARDLLRVFDTTTWEYTEVREENIGGRWVTPDGRSLIGNHENTIRITDTETFETRTLVSEAHEGDVKDLAISDDGSLVASAGSDGFVRVFDLATGELRHELSVGATQAQNVEFVDNDRHLMVTPQEGQVLIMTLDTSELLDVARARVTRGFNPAECDKYQIDPCPDLESIQEGT